MSAAPARQAAATWAVVNNLVVVSDLHIGCQLAICPPDGARLDNGGVYRPSPMQHKLYAWWSEFWLDFVPDATKHEPYAVCVNGDALDGRHHDTTTQWSHNLADQALAADALLRPIAASCPGRFYMVRGTEAHVGQAGEEEERLARVLGAVPNAAGQAARYELWKLVGPKLVHCLHHIGGTGSQFYESTALHKEVIESIVEAGRSENRYPDVIVRSHRHRYLKEAVPVKNGEAIGVCTPGWQLKTGYAWKLASARLSQPQIGGVVVRFAHGELFIRRYVKFLEREDPE